MLKPKHKLLPKVSAAAAASMQQSKVVPNSAPVVAEPKTNVGETAMYVNEVKIPAPEKKQFNPSVDYTNPVNLEELSLKGHKDLLNHLGGNAEALLKGIKNGAESRNKLRAEIDPLLAALSGGNSANSTFDEADFAEFDPMVDYSDPSKVEKLSDDGLADLLIHLGGYADEATENAETSDEARQMLIAAINKIYAEDSDESTTVVVDAVPTASDFDAEESSEFDFAENETVSTAQVMQEITGTEKVDDSDFDELLEHATNGDEDKFLEVLDSMDRKALLSHFEQHISLTADQLSEISDLGTSEIREELRGQYSDVLAVAENKALAEVEAEDESETSDETDDFETHEEEVEEVERDDPENYVSDEDEEDGVQIEFTEEQLAEMDAEIEAEMQAEAEAEALNAEVIRHLEEVDYLGSEVPHFELTTSSRIILVLSAGTQQTREIDQEELAAIYIGENAMCANHPLRRRETDDKNMGWFVDPMQSLSQMVAEFNMKQRVYCGPTIAVHQTVYGICENLQKVAKALVYGLTDDNVLPEGIDLSDLASINVQPSVGDTENEIVYNFFVSLNVPMLGRSRDSEKLRGNLTALKKSAQAIADEATEESIEIMVTFATDLDLLLKSRAVVDLFNKTGYYSREQLVEYVREKAEQAAEMQDSEFEFDGELDEEYESEEVEETEEEIDSEEETESEVETDIVHTLLSDFDSISYLLPWSANSMIVIE